MSFKRARRPDPAGGGGAAGVRMSAAGFALTSSGAAGVDAALCGGLPLGALALLAEDSPTAHHAALARLFLAQGLAHGHAVALAQQHAPPADALAALPAARGFAPAPQQAQGGRGPAGALNIAWRYAEAGKGGAGARPAGASAAAAMYRHAFDLSEEVAPAEDAAVSHLGLGRSEKLSVLLEDVRAHVLAAAKRGLVARVAVCGLSEDMWEVGSGGVTAFLHALRVLVQRAGAVALVTAPRYAVTMALVREADVAMALDTFDGRGAGEAGLGSEWDGVLRIDKRFARPGLISRAQDGEDLWVFKRGRRKYVFEVAASAPDDEHGQQGTQEGGHSANGAGSLCQPGPQQNKFEF